MHHTGQKSDPVQSPGLALFPGDSSFQAEPALPGEIMAPL